MFGDKTGEQIGRIAIRELNANADIRANVAVQARPQLAANWRVDPEPRRAGEPCGHQSQRVRDQSERQRPDPSADGQDGGRAARQLRERARNDPTLEQTARREWAKMCRSIPLPAAAPGLPNLFLEMKPTKAVAAQPRVDAANVNLMLGIEAQTVVTTSQTKPDCPFPAALQIVPPLDKGKINVGVPIDMPFTEVNKIISAQLKGRTFPEDDSAPVAVTVKSATVSPSGDAAADLAAGQRQGKEELVRSRRRRHRACVGTAGTGSGAADPQARRHRACGGIRSRVRPARRRRHARRCPSCRRRWPNARRST